MASTNGDGKPARARIAFRRVQRERDGNTHRLTVLCTRLMRVIDVRECRDCERCRGLCIDPGGRDLFLRCVSSAPEDPSASEHPVTNAVAQVMSSPVLCLSGSDDLTSALALLAEHGAGAAPVVDVQGRAIGILTKSDLVQHCREQDAHVRLDDDAGTRLDDGTIMERRSPPLVREIMSHVVFTLHQDADISRAAALMAYEGVHHVVVAAQDGRAIGIVSSLDVLRWVARQHGYVVPEAT